MFVPYFFGGSSSKSGKAMALRDLLQITRETKINKNMVFAHEPGTVAITMK